MIVTVGERQSKIPRWSAMALAICLVVASRVGLAQSIPSGTLEEIIVTAQKREQSVQDVPIAISAFSGPDLDRLGIKSSKDLEAVVPNMRWIGTDGSSVSNVFIRGVGDISFQVNQVGAVGLYMDEVSLNSPILSSFGLYDLERVEVLRGPQNTLFGRNTTGGAIQFVSQKPSVDSGWAGYTELNGGNYGRNDVEGAVNIPLGDRMAARLSGSRFAQGNYLDNLNLGIGEGAYQRSAGRAQLLWKVTDDLDALIGANLGTFRGSVGRYKQIGLGTPGDPGNSANNYCKANLTHAEPGNGCVDQTGFADDGNYLNEYANSVNLFQMNVDGGSARFDWRLPAATLTSLGAYEHSDSKRSEDSESGPSYIFNFMQHTNADQWSQELRAVSRGDTAVRWLGGVYYFNEEAHWDTVVPRANQALTNVLVPGVPIPEAGVTQFLPFTLSHQRDEVYSAYGQLEFKLTEKAQLTTGLRFTSDRKTGVVEDGIATDTVPIYGPNQFLEADQINTLLAGGNQVAGGATLRQVCPKPLPFTECYAFTPFDLRNNALGGKVALDYRFTDKVLGYASVSRGFKAGSVSIAPLDYIARGGSTVSPEYLWTYELGLKTQAFDDTLRIDGAVFFNHWTNEQLFLPLNTPPFGLNPVYTNVPTTESYGLDLEIQWKPAPDWFLSSNFGALHSAVKDIGPALAAADGATVGSVLLASPKITWNALVRKDWSVAGDLVSLQGNWTYTGSQHFDLNNTPDQIEPGYWVYNAAAAYRFGRKQQFEASLWGKNLTRTQYCLQRSSQAGIPFGDTAVCVPNEAARFFGVSLRGSF